MAFTGDLEQLPIVDVIQLLNSTRKSGILVVKGRKGESQLVFKDGYIVSASHLNGSIRIGQVIVEMGFVTQNQLDHALQSQQTDIARRPLAIMFIEMGILAEQDAFKALQRLVEITLVEILTWKRGQFTLDHLRNSVDFDFKYYPEKMNHEVNVNTQSILMDALRIFDERKRDGLIEDEPDDAELEELSSDELISVDDLGLGDIDHLFAKLPQAFSGVNSFDPVALQRQKIMELQTNLSEADLEKLASMLARYTIESVSGERVGTDGPRVVIFSKDALLLYGLNTVLTKFGALSVPVLSGDELAKALAKEADTKMSWLIVDAPLPKMKLARNSHLCTFQLVPKGEFDLALKAYRQGVAAVVPRPVNGQVNFVEEFIVLLEFIPEFIRDYR